MRSAARLVSLPTMSSHAHVTVAIDLGGTSIKLGLFDGSLALATLEIPATGTIADLASVRDSVARISASADATNGFGGIGIAVPGVVDRAAGALIGVHDKHPWALGRDLVRWAEDAFNAPAVLENDARAALVGERRYGAASDHPDAVLLTLGTCIGTAATMSGEPVRGASDHAGVLGGHITMQLDGPLCNCGNVGCAEALASTWALPRIIADHPELADHPEWADRIDRGALGIRDLMTAPTSDRLAADIAERFIRVWGGVAVGLCHAYDPSIVIVTGGVMRSAARILPGIRAHVDAHLWSTSPRPIIHTPAHPENSVLLGLAALAETQPEETR